MLQDVQFTMLKIYLFARTRLLAFLIVGCSFVDVSHLQADPLADLARLEIGFSAPEVTRSQMLQCKTRLQRHTLRLSDSDELFGRDLRVGCHLWAQLSKLEGFNDARSGEALRPARTPGGIQFSSATIGRLDTGPRVRVFRDWFKTNRRLRDATLRPPTTAEIWLRWVPVDDPLEGPLFVLEKDNWHLLVEMDMETRTIRWLDDLSDSDVGFQDIRTYYEKARRVRPKAAAGEIVGTREEKYEPLVSDGRSRFVQMKEIRFVTDRNVVDANLDLKKFSQLVDVLKPAIQRVYRMAGADFEIATLITFHPDRAHEVAVSLHGVRDPSTGKAAYDTIMELHTLKTKDESVRVLLHWLVGKGAPKEVKKPRELRPFNTTDTPGSDGLNAPISP